jgi:hypothetical protein
LTTFRGSCSPLPSADDARFCHSTDPLAQRTFPAASDSSEDSSLELLLNSTSGARGFCLSLAAALLGVSWHDCDGAGGWVDELASPVAAVGPVSRWPPSRSATPGEVFFVKTLPLKAGWGRHLRPFGFRFRFNNRFSLVPCQSDEQHDRNKNQLTIRKR